MVVPVPPICEQRAIAQALRDIDDLLASLELDVRTVVVERNGTILPDRSSFASLALSADDSIEIVHFVGGG